MKYCILGAGRTGQAMVAYLSQLGQSVGVWDRNPETCRRIQEAGIRIEGNCQGVYHPQVISDIGETTRAEVLLVMTTANGHRPLAKLLRGHLREHQLILIFNGNMGAWETYSELRQEVQDKQVLVVETGGMLLLCDYNEEGCLYLKSIKGEMNLAAIPASAKEQAIRRLQPEYPQFYPVDSVIETSLNNANPVMHVPITLFNFSRTENGEAYGYYSDGASPCIVSFIERIDAERCEVIRAMGARPISCLEIINSFWPDKYDNLLDAIRNNKTYQSGKGPKTLDYRYITEDIPYGIMPLTRLGAALGVPTPFMDAMLLCYQGLLGQNSLLESPCVEGFAQTVTAG